MIGRAVRWVSSWLGVLPGRLESPGQVKRRLLFVTLIAALTVLGASSVMSGPGGGPFNQEELRDLSGLPVPPVHFVQDADGTYHELSPDELEQLRQLQELIRQFPAPQNFGGGSVPTVQPTPNAQDGGG
ncbi:MAG: hypothetical protein WD770_10430 [Actinomycetota bacterium]